jgi:hypothetical protein
MTKSRTLAAVAAVLLFAAAWLAGCSDDGNPVAPVPGGETATHSVSLGGRSHAPGYCEPLTNCTDCHGGDLNGGSGPSCFNCHGARWNVAPCR